MSAQTTARVFELRTYTTYEGKLPDLVRRFRDHTVELFKRHGIIMIGFWLPQDDPLTGHTLVYIVAHSSREDAKKNWATFQADPEWIKVKTESEADGKLVIKIDSVYMDPSDFSAIQ